MQIDNMFEKSAGILKIRFVFIAAVLFIISLIHLYLITTNLSVLLCQRNLPQAE